MQQILPRSRRISLPCKSWIFYLQLIIKLNVIYFVQGGDNYYSSTANQSSRLLLVELGPTELWLAELSPVNNSWIWQNFWISLLYFPLVNFCIFAKIPWAKITFNLALKNILVFTVLVNISPLTALVRK